MLPRTIPSWTHFHLHVRPTHLEHLLRPLRMDALRVEDLCERIQATQRLSAQHQLALGINAPGPYELITFPNPERIELALIVHQQPHDSWTQDTAGRLCPIIGGLASSPNSARSLNLDFQTHVRFAGDLCHPVAIRLHGLCDLLVWGDGRWVVFGRHSLSSPRLLSDPADLLPTSSIHTEGQQG